MIDQVNSQVNRGHNALLYLVSNFSLFHERGHLHVPVLLGNPVSEMLFKNINCSNCVARGYKDCVNTRLYCVMPVRVIIR